RSEDAPAVWHVQTGAASPTFRCRTGRVWIWVNKTHKIYKETMTTFQIRQISLEETEEIMLFNKPLAEIEESDLQMLVDTTVREGREVEYKEVLTIHTDEQKQEFLNDVSSFANATGGNLIYGIKESKEDAGRPIEVCGL